MTDTPAPTFDLLTQPWIPVRRLDGHATELGILDVFRRAHQLRSIGGELPTAVFGVIRVLEAVLHRAWEVTDPVGTWEWLWNLPALPMSSLEAYLSDHTDRFDLLHPRLPFFQVADLRTGKGEVSGLEKLIADVPNGVPFFSTRTGRALREIPFGEAARWVVHAHAFDVSGIKSGAVGDPRVKGGKGYPIGTGWAGNLGGVLIEGDTLRETLLLNLVLGADERGEQPQPESDLPVWERDPLGAAVEELHGRPRPGPAGPADLFTWQSRRIRLAHDAVHVTGVVLANGDPLGPQNQFAEGMTSWRRSENQEKKLGGRVYMPRTHDPSRSLWRGLEALLPHGVREQQRAEGARWLPPATLGWISLLRDRNVLSPARMLQTRTIGMVYGPQRSTVEEIVDDSLAIHAALFGAGGQELAARSTSAVAATEVAVQAVTNLAGNLVVAAGGENAGVRARTREDAYFILDEPFRRWLAELDADTDVVETLFAWFDTARHLLRQIGRDLVTSAGPTAWVGRTNDLGTHVDTALADAWFQAALTKALPYPPAAAKSDLPPQTESVGVG